MIANGIHGHEGHEQAASRSKDLRAGAAAYADTLRKRATLTADFARETLAQIQKRPVLATASAGAIGVLLGGLVFPNLGRLAFVATVGYFANEIWRREGGLQLDKLVAALGQTPDPSPTTSPSEGRD